MGQNGCQKSEQFWTVVELRSRIIELIFIIFTSIIVRKKFPGITGDYLTLFVAIPLLVLFILVSSFRRGIQRARKKRSSALLSTGILVLLAASTYFFISAFKEHRTVYFLIDASDNMKGYLEQVSPQISLAVNSAKFLNNVELGMAVYGGTLTGLGGCEDVTRLVNPSPSEESVPKIITQTEYISKIKPSGVAGLQNAILDSFSVLKDRRGLQQILVITYGLDDKCGALSRGFLDKIAKDFSINYELQIITMSETLEADQQALKGLTDVYHHVGIDQLQARVEVALTSPSQLYKLIYR
jgi:hypothetical protein